MRSLRNLAMPLFLAGGLLFGSSVFGNELKVGDKMPEPKGEWLQSGICYENQEEGSRGGYDMYGINARKRKIEEVVITLRNGGVVFMRYDNNGSGTIYSDLNDNRIIESIRTYFPTHELIGAGLKSICPRLELD